MIHTRRHGRSLATAVVLSIACHLGLALAIGSRIAVLAPDAGSGPMAVALVEPRAAAGAAQRTPSAMAVSEAAPVPSERARRTASRRPDAEVPVRARAREIARRVPRRPVSRARRAPAVERGDAVPTRGESVEAREQRTAADTAPREERERARAARPAAGEAGAAPGEGTAAAAAAAGSAAGSAAASGGADGLRLWCRECPAPVYPARARRRGWQGTVDVDLRVGRDGRVEQAQVGRSSGVGSLDAAALAVARRSRFWIPGEGDGLQGQLRYRFVLEDAQGRWPL